MYENNKYKNTSDQTFPFIELPNECMLVNQFSFLYFFSTSVVYQTQKFHFSGVMVLFSGKKATFNPIHATGIFLSPWKHQKTRGFQGDRKIPVAWNGLNIVGFFCFYFFIFYLFFFVIGYLCRWCFRWVRFTYLKSLIQQQGCNVLDLSHFMRMFLIMSLLSNILQ